MCASDVFIYIAQFVHATDHLKHAVPHCHVVVLHALLLPQSVSERHPEMYRNDVSVFATSWDTHQASKTSLNTQTSVMERYP